MFYDDGEFKYEKMWDFISEPYMNYIYMRDKDELRKNVLNYTNI